MALRGAVFLLQLILFPLNSFLLLPLYFPLMLNQPDVLIAEGETEVESKQEVTHLDNNCDKNEVEVQVVGGYMLRPEEEEDEEEK